LGAVKIQIKKDHEWNNVSLNNIDVVKFLVKFRWKFDDNYICKNFYTDEVTKSNGIPDFHEEITCLYADLDMYIKKANLYKIQRIILKYIMLGVDFKELSILLEKKLNKTYPVYDLKMLFNSACYKILYEYNYDYQFWLESSSKIKINNNFQEKIKNLIIIWQQKFILLKPMGLAGFEPTTSVVWRRRHNHDLLHKKINQKHHQF